MFLFVPPLVTFWGYIGRNRANEANLSNKSVLGSTKAVWRAVSHLHAVPAGYVPDFIHDLI